MGNIRLELVDIKHLDKMVEWRNKPRVYSSFFSGKPSSIEQQKEWFYGQSDNEENFIICFDDKISFSVAPPVIATRYIGAISLYDIDDTNMRAEFGRFYIGDDDYLGRGLGEEALLLLLDYGFYDLILNKIYADVFPTNAKIIKLYRKVGFVVETILMQHYFSSGEFIDAIRMTLTKENYCGGD